MADSFRKESLSLPAVTVDRLVRCHRLCERLHQEGREYTSSGEIGERLGCSSSQVRKDFSRIGRLGMRGSGYRVSELAEVLGRVTGRGRSWNVALVGAGNLGSALLSHVGFENQGFHFVAVFDADPTKVGTTIGGLHVHDVSAMPKVLPATGAQIGVIAVPAAGARWAGNLLAQHGIRAILNFAPLSLGPSDDAFVSNVDLTVEIEKLCYYLVAGEVKASAAHGSE